MMVESMHNTTYIIYSYPEYRIYKIIKQIFDICRKIGKFILPEIIIITSTNKEPNKQTENTINNFLKYFWIKIICILAFFR